MNIRKEPQIASILFFSFLVLSLNAQNKSTLSIEQIMQAEKFIGYSPSNIQWAEDSKQVYFNWNPASADFREYFAVSWDGTTASIPKQVSEAENAILPLSSGTYNKAKTLKVYSRNGDLYLQKTADNTITQITYTNDGEWNPIFVAQDQKIAYRSGMNIFVWDIEKGSTEQWTDFRKGNERKDPAKPDYEQWLEEDQLALFDILQKKKANAEAAEARHKKLKIKRPLAIYLGESDLNSTEISPDGRYIVYTTINRPKVKQTLVPNFVTESGHTTAPGYREKVGNPQESYETAIYDRELDTFYILKLEDISGIYDKAKFIFDYNKDNKDFKAKYEKPRAVIIHGPKFSSDGRSAVVDIKSMDNKDRWLMLVDLETGGLSLLDRQHDDAWVGGPGVLSWNMVPGNTGWITDSDWFWYHSEADGFSHLYKINVKTKEKIQLTKGQFEITDANLSKDGKFFYLTSSEVDPGERHFYKMSVDGGARTQLTSLVGNNEVTLSPDEQWLAIRYSYSNKPWELYLQANEANAKPVQITDSRTEAFKRYNWRDPELVYFTAEDGAQVRARLYRPAKAKKGGPAVIFVHGAGYLQNVHKWWSTYYREYMFHNILADNGYTVLDIDYRASSGYGRDWRTGIYQHMGGKDLSDHVDGAKFLVQKYGIDAKKIGIYGGSYGGFITLMAMFNAPETFRAGAAIRSVTDWAHYNHPYTSNILNTPVEDSIAYRKSSPIYFADGLKGDLLMLHGMVDDNVQYQDIIRLTQRLIELGKENWELASYPIEPHGFVEPSSWTDEYKRIFKLFERTLK